MNNVDSRVQPQEQSAHAYSRYTWTLPIFTFPACPQDASSCVNRCALITKSPNVAWEDLFPPLGLRADLIFPLPVFFPVRNAEATAAPR